jgi:hypothetical protein
MKKWKSAIIIAVAWLIALSLLYITVVKGKILFHP